MADASSSDTTSDYFNECFSDISSEKSFEYVVGSQRTSLITRRSERNFLQKLYTREVAANRFSKKKNTLHHTRTILPIDFLRSRYYAQDSRDEFTRGLEDPDFSLLGSVAVVRPLAFRGFAGLGALFWAWCVLIWMGKFKKGKGCFEAWALLIFPIHV